MRLGKWNHPINQEHCKRVPFLLTCTNPRKNGLFRDVVSVWSKHIPQVTSWPHFCIISHGRCSHYRTESSPLQGEQWGIEFYVWIKGLLKETGLSIQPLLKRQTVEASSTMASSDWNLQIKSTALICRKVSCGSEHTKCTSTCYLYSSYLTEWQHWCETESLATKKSLLGAHVTHWAHDCSWSQQLWI